VSQGNVEIVKGRIDAFNRRDVDAFAELATSDFAWLPGISEAFEEGGYRGREGIETWFGEIHDTSEEFGVLAEELRDIGDRVLVLGRHWGRGRASGASADGPIGIILDFAAARSRASTPISITARRCERLAWPSRPHSVGVRCEAEVGEAWGGGSRPTVNAPRVSLSRRSERQHWRGSHARSSSAARGTCLSRAATAGPVAHASDAAATRKSSVPGRLAGCDVVWEAPDTLPTAGVIRGRDAVLEQ